MHSKKWYRKISGSKCGQKVRVSRFALNRSRRETGEIKPFWNYGDPSISMISGKSWWEAWERRYGRHGETVDRPLSISDDIWRIVG
jgi:hypothetical protein